MYYDEEREENWERERRDYDRADAAKAAEIRRLHQVCHGYQDQMNQAVELLTKMEEIIAYIPNYRDVPKDVLADLCKQVKELLGS